MNDDRLTVMCELNVDQKTIIAFTIRSIYLRENFYWNSHTQTIVITRRQWTPLNQVAYAVDSFAHWFFLCFLNNFTIELCLFWKLSLF